MQNRILAVGVMVARMALDHKAQVRGLYGQHKHKL